MKLKTEERRELIRLDEHKALLCVEISRLQRAVHEIEDKLKEQDPFTLLRVSLIYMKFTMFPLKPSFVSAWWKTIVQSRQSSKERIDFSKQKSLPLSELRQDAGLENKDLDQAYGHILLGCKCGTFPQPQ